VKGRQNGAFLERFLNILERFLQKPDDFWRFWEILKKAGAKVRRCFWARNGGCGIYHEKTVEPRIGTDGHE